MQGVRAAQMSWKLREAITSSCSVNKQGSRPGDANIQRASDLSAQLLLVCTFQPGGSLKQQRGGSYPLSPQRLPFRRRARICKTKKKNTKK